MEIHEDQPNEKSTGHLHRLSAAREAATVTCDLAETQRQAGEQEGVTGKTGSLGTPCWRLLVWGSWRQAKTSQASCVIGECGIWFSLAGLKLQVGQKPGQPAI